MKTLQFGIIGAGNIASVHVVAIRSLPDAQLVAVVDSDYERAESFARTHHVECERDYRDLLERPDIDVVTICTPHYLHAPITLEAAAAGKHVLCEKPMACTPEQCDQMATACAQANVTLGVISQNRFERLPRLLKEALDSGRLGRLLWASSTTPWHRSQEYYTAASWRGTWSEAGGGVLINQAIHAIDLLLWLVGMPSTVTAQMRTLNHQVEVEDSALAILEYPSGHLGLIQATTNGYPGYPEHLEFYGDKGTAVFHKGQARLEWHLLDPAEDRIDEAEVSSAAGAPMDIKPTGHIAQFQDFAAALRAGKSPTVDAKEGRRSIDLISAIYRSARSGIPVLLSEQ